MTTHHSDLNYQYIESNTYRVEYGDLEKNDERKGLEVLLNGYLFKVHRRNKGSKKKDKIKLKSINWLCKERTTAPCTASLTITEEEKVIYFVDHVNHNEKIEME